MTTSAPKPPVPPIVPAPSIGEKEIKYDHPVKQR